MPRYDSPNIASATARSPALKKIRILESNESLHRCSSADVFFFRRNKYYTVVTIKHVCI